MNDRGTFLVVVLVIVPVAAAVINLLNSISQSLRDIASALEVLK